MVDLGNAPKTAASNLSLLQSTIRLEVFANLENPYLHKKYTSATLQLNYAFLKSLKTIDSVHTSLRFRHRHPLKACIRIQHKKAANVIRTAPYFRFFLTSGPYWTLVTATQRFYRNRSLIVSYDIASSFIIVREIQNHLS